MPILPPMPITDKLRQEWVAALDSEQYPQCRRALADTKTRSYCCLGLLMKLAGRDPLSGDHWEYPASSATISQDDQESMIRLNDDDSLSFRQIAQRLRDNPLLCAPQS